jgi:predicted nucleic acid-binding protein
MARYVISDANPLIGLAIVDGLAWLPALFGPVWIPPSVQREVLPGLNVRGELELAAAIKGKVLRVWRKTIPVAAADLGDLDEGETDCIRIALSEGPANAILLMDERAGRAIAHEHGIQVVGTSAVIGFARKHGLIESARASFERLHASDFRISAEVIQTVLRRVGEL